jgi:enamine deaminase RidA (YjgF/YER057c/UK114 family)
MSEHNTANQEIRRRLAARGLALPRPWQLPPDVDIPATLVRVTGTRAAVSAHVPIDDEGAIATPRGKVGAEVDLPAAQRAGVRSLLGIVASLELALGDLGRIVAWRRLFCMVNTGPGFVDFPAVFNPASRLLLDLFGEEIGAHARAAIGVAGLPWDVPVEIEADVDLR